MKIELNSNLIGVDYIFSTYQGLGDPVYTLNKDIMDEDFENGYTNIHPDYYGLHYDHDKYMKDWTDRVHSEIEFIFNDVFLVLGIKFKYIRKGYYSPREYNFKADQVDFILDLNWDKLEKAVLLYIEEKKNKFESFLKENYSSCSGFISFTANNYNKWKEDFKEKRVQEIGAFLRFMIFIVTQSEDEDSLQNYFSYSEVFNDMHYSDYVDTSELDKFLANPLLHEGKEWQQAIINRKIKSYHLVDSVVNDIIRSNYSKGKEEVIDLILNDSDYKEELKPFIEGLINYEFNKIDSNTMELEFN